MSRHKLSGKERRKREAFLQEVFEVSKKHGYQLVITQSPAQWQVKPLEVENFVKYNRAPFYKRVFNSIVDRLNFNVRKQNHENVKELGREASRSREEAEASASGRC